jgi:hypothetical protein
VVCVARVCRRSEPVRLSAAGCSSSSKPIAAARLHEPQLAADDTCATATTTATTITTRFLRITTTTTANALPPLLKIKNRVDTLHGKPIRARAQHSKSQWHSPPWPNTAHAICLSTARQLSTTQRSLRLLQQIDYGAPTSAVAGATGTAAIALASAPFLGPVAGSAKEGVTAASSGCGGG